MGFFQAGGKGQARVLTDGPVARQTLMLAVPSAVEQAMLNIVRLADMYWMGRVGGMAVASVAIVATWGQARISGGSLAIGMLAARFGDGINLGFLAETERQVEAHLKSHLDRLPEQDVRSREIVEQMKTDEVAHAETAERLGAVRVASLDHRHFSVIRPAHCDAFELVP